MAPHARLEVGEERPADAAALPIAAHDQRVKLDDVARVHVAASDPAQHLPALNGGEADPTPQRGPHLALGGVNRHPPLGQQVDEELRGLAPIAVGAALAARFASLFAALRRARSATETTSSGRARPKRFS